MLEKSNSLIGTMSHYLSNYKLRQYKKEETSKPLELKNNNKNHLSTGKIQCIPGIVKSK